MASRFYSEFSERKTRALAKPPTTPKGSKSPGGSVSETTANWPSAGPSGSPGWNRKSKVPIVKTYAKKMGLP